MESIDDTFRYSLNRSGELKKIVIRIILIINIILAGLMIISSLSVYISPEKIWYLAFLGLIFPYILIINILFLVFWVIFKKRYFLISLLVIILSWNNLGKFIQFNLFKSKPPDDEVVVKLISYNVSSLVLINDLI